MFLLLIRDSVHCFLAHVYSQFLYFGNSEANRPEKPCWPAQFLPWPSIACAVNERPGEGNACSLLEHDQWLEDAIKLFIHDLKRPLHLVKGEGMGRQEGGVYALHFEDTQQT